MAAKVERGGICESQTPPFSERDQDRLNQPSRSQVARDPNKINRRAEALRMFGCSLTFWSRSLQAPVQNASTNRWEALPQRNDRCRVRRPDQARSGLPPQPFPRSEEHTSELQSLMRISYSVYCLNKKNKHDRQH